MKKFFCLLVCVLVLSPAFLAFAENSSVEVYVSVSVQPDKVPLALEKVTVTDADGDGVLSIADALFAAHESRYEGGAAAGLSVQESAYGLSLIKLWGVANGGSYGYYVNNASPMSLADPVSDGDHVYAYCYSDTTSYSDTYCFFAQIAYSATVDRPVTLSVNSMGFDAAWQPVSAPMAGLQITVDGVATQSFSAQDGTFTLSFDKPGTYRISAQSADRVLVAPVAQVVVSPESAPVTGDTQGYIAWLLLVSLAGLGLFKAYK